MRVLRGGRAALMAACALAIALGWLYDNEAAVGLGFWIGLEEFYETSMVLGLLHMGIAGIRGGYPTYARRFPCRSR